MKRSRNSNGTRTFNEWFRDVACLAADAVGHAWSFLLAVLVIIIWAVLGPMFHFSDTWQLIINTGTTIVTFLTVFLIQNTQNRDAKAIQLKLDELIHAVHGARNRMIDIENMTDEELTQLKKEFERLSRRPDGIQGSSRP